jgi:hypothetical protein
MEFDALMNAVGAVGFPIVLATGLLYVVLMIFKAYREDVDKLKEALANNTLVLQKLIDKIDHFNSTREEKGDE